MYTLARVYHVSMPGIPCTPFQQSDPRASDAHFREEKTWRGQGLPWGLGHYLQLPLRNAKAHPLSRASCRVLNCIQCSRNSLQRYVLYTHRHMHTCEHPSRILWVSVHKSESLWVSHFSLSLNFLICKMREADFNISKVLFIFLTDMWWLGWLRLSQIVHVK